MPPRKKPLKVTTSATKAKLPLPKGHPQRFKIGKRKPMTIRIPFMGKRGMRYVTCRLSEAHRVHESLTFTGKARATDAELAEGHRTRHYVKYTPLDLTRYGIPTPLPKRDEAWVDGYEAWAAKRAELVADIASPTPSHLQPPPPDTSAYPWPLKALWNVDTAINNARTRLSGWLTRCAQWVAP